MSKIKLITICVAVFIVIPFVAGQTKADLSDGLVAYYPLNGSANDAGVNGNHGTAYGVAWTQNRYGSANQAAMFNNIDSVILIPESSSLNIDTFQTGYTHAAWIRPLSVPSTTDYYDTIFSFYGCAFGMDLWRDSVIDEQVVLRAFHTDGNNSTWSFGPFEGVPLDAWYHVAFTWDGSTGSWTGFLDGEPSTSFTVEGLGLWGSVGPRRAAIGRDFWYERWYFDGPIDDVFIYNRALSDSEVTELYLMPAPMTLSGLVFMPQDVPDLGYSLDEADLVYFYSFNLVQSYNTSTGGWSIHMPTDWVYFDWPFYYELDSGTLWFALPPESGLMVYHFSTGLWEQLPRIIPW